jgi:hypothetical protein
MNKLKKIITLLFFTVTALQAHAQWSLSPEVLMADASSKGLKLVKQETQDDYLSLRYEYKAGFNIGYLFKAEKLVCIIKEVDPTLIATEIPRGIKECAGTDCLWIDYERKVLTKRQYENGIVVDTISELIQP